MWLQVKKMAQIQFCAAILCQAQIIHNAKDTMCYILITFPTVGILLYADECPSNAVLASKLYTTNCLA